MSNTRRPAIRISAVRLSSAFAATALLTVAGASTASAAIDPLSGVADVTSVTSTVTGTAGKLPLGGDAAGTATSVTKLTEDAPLVGDLTDGLLGGGLLGDDLTDGLLGGDLTDDLLDDGILQPVTDDVVAPVLDTVDDLVETVGDDVLSPVLHTVETVVDDVTDTVDGVVGDVTDTVDGVVADKAGSKTTKTTKTVKVSKKVVDDSDHGAVPQGGVAAGSLPHTGASALPIYLLAGGAALAAGGVGIRRFVLRAGQ